MNGVDSCVCDLQHCEGFYCPVANSQEIVQYPCCLCQEATCLAPNCPAASGEVEKYKKELLSLLDKEIPCTEKRPIAHINGFNIISPNYG